MRSFRALLPTDVGESLLRCTTNFMVYVDAVVLKKTLILLGSLRVCLPPTGYVQQGY